MDDIQIRLETARELAVAAGRRTLQAFYNRDFHAEMKADHTPVTEIDRQTEQFLRDEILARFATDGIVGEEFDAVSGQSGFRWILDPIDGTKSFISGVPLYGTMVGVEVEGEPHMGAVYIPGLAEGIYAARGLGAWHFRGEETPRPARVSQQTDLAKAVVVTSEIETFGQRNAAELYQQLAEQVYFLRTWGDCYGYLLVATGRVDVMIDPILSIWDAAAVSPILTEAGGVFVDWQGRSRIDSGDALGTNPDLGEQLLELTRAAPAYRPIP